MPLKLKDPKSRDRFYEKAIRRMVQDEPLTEFTQSETDAATAAALSNVYATMPDHLLGRPISSLTHKEFLKAARMYNSLVATETLDLEKEIEQNTEQAYSVLDDLQRELLTLRSQINEDEVISYGEYTNIHFNAWVRTEDQPMDYDAGGWLVDFKTGLPYLPGNLAEIEPGAGLVLPPEYESTALITNVSILGEDTDYGDTTSVILSTDPLNLLRKNKAFRHVIMRQEFDGTSRDFKQEPAYLGILVDMPAQQLVNYLSIRPMGHSTVQIEDILYVDDDGNDVSLNFQAFTSDTFTTFFFEPVRTNALKIKFVQFSPVTKTEYTNSDRRTTEINDLLRGQGFSQLIDNPEETMQGRVYDFSLQEIILGTRAYKSTGIYRSGLRNVSSPVGLQLVLDSESIEVSTPAFGEVDQSVPSGLVLPEAYVGIKLSLDGVVKIDQLVPVIDSTPLQRESIPLSGNVGRLKFVPDTDLQVWRNETLLGAADYEISIDGGATWLAPGSYTSLFLQEQIDQTYAGRVHVRIANPDNKSYYWVSYTPYFNQQLNPAGSLRLQKGRVVFGPELNGATGTVQTVIALRSLSNNIYLSPVVKSYFLKVREYAS